MGILIRIPILILIPMVCLTRNIQFQNGFYDSPEGLRCQMCPKGKFILKTCEEDGGASLCSVCPKRTFTSTVNSATECEECTPCRITMRLRSPCTDVSNTVCECPPGLFWVGYLGYDGICLHHTVCKEDEIVAVKGTANSDTICKKAPPTTLQTLTSDTPTLATTEFASIADSLSTVPISTKESKVKDDIQPNSTTDVRYHVFIQGHRHTRPLKHHDIHKFSKPKNLSTDFPVFQTTTENVHNATQILTESSEIQRFQKKSNGSGIKVSMNESETFNNFKENKTHSIKVMTNEIPHVVINQQMYRKPSTVASSGGKRKRNKGKRKKLRRRRKKNRKDQKRRRERKCRHKVEKKRKRCERRRKRMHRRKKTEAELEIRSVQKGATL